MDEDKKDIEEGNETVEIESDNAESKIDSILEKCMRERDEYLDGWKRAKADFINYKKEESERLVTVARFSNESLVSELISVLDSFDLGISVLENNKAAQKGMSLIKLQLGDVLKKYGLRKISVVLGEAFDPKEQEAIGEVFSEYDPGSITEEIESGYILHGKILRPAKVKISKGKGG